MYCRPPRLLSLDIQLLLHSASSLSPQMASLFPTLLTLSVCTLALPLSCDFSFTSWQTLPVCSYPWTSQYKSQRKMHSNAPTLSLASHTIRHLPKSIDWINVSPSLRSLRHAFLLCMFIHDLSYAFLLFAVWNPYNYIHKHRFIPLAFQQIFFKALEKPNHLLSSCLT